MAKVNVSEAIKLAGVSRQTFYTKYLSSGIISTEVDHQGKKCIDTSELLRVFGDIKQDNIDKTEDMPNRHVLTPQKDSQVAALQVEVQLLRERMADKDDQIRKGEEREQRLMAQVENLTAVIKQIEHRTAQQEKPRGFWERLLRRGL